MLLLLAFVSGLSGLHAGIDTQKNFIQTTVPEKISSSNANENPENNVGYVITLEGKQYFIHVKKQSFLSPTAVTHYYDKNDEELRTPLITQMDCNYNGYVSGFPNSLVTLNICSGLRGIIQFKNISYGIEPMEALSGFVHLIYEEKTDESIIRLFENDMNNLLYDSKNAVRKYPERTDFSKLFQRSIEIYVVVDKNLFVYMGSDTKIVTQKVIQIIGLANTIFTPLKLTLVISSIEIWSNKNKIPTVEQPHLTLFRFLEWRKEYLKYRSHHFAFLFALGKHHVLLGASLPEKLCDKDFAAGVALYPEGFSLESYTIIIVQLLGISLGLNYDSTDSCYCSGDVCAMMPKAIFSRGIKDFSTCSLDDFKSITSHSDVQCLWNSNYSPFEKPFYKQQNPPRVCGNSIIEQGEQCDCGTAANCTHKDCCDPRSCTKIAGKACGSGECCTKDCKIKPTGVLCRKVQDKQCDFAEYCNGENQTCPPNTFLRDGEYCDDGEAFCYNGQCNSATKQCKNLIGGDTRGAPFPCYDEVNARGDRFGNCGREPCNFADLLCGKLVCVWPHKSFVLRTNLSVIYTHVYDEMCVSTYKPAAKPQDQPTVTTYNSAQDRDETFVADGTICGPNMLCVRFSCKVVNSLKNIKLCEMSDHCGGNGVCNNFNHCQCKKGFAPPNCSAEAGEFGSIDDGHFRTGGRSDIVGRHAVFKKKQLHLILYISLPVFIIVGAVLLKQNKIKEIWYRGDTESDTSDRSKTEESSSSISHDSLSPP